MAKVVLINPAVREDDTPKHVPYGMAILAAIISNEGHEVQVYDGNAWRGDESEVQEVLEADDWDVVALGGISTTYGYVRDFVSQTKKYSPKSLVVVGGGLMTSMPREIMSFLPGADIGVIGEAYVTFSEILKKIDDGSFDWASVKGIAYRDTNSKVQLTPPQTLIEDVDTLPYPAWDMFPLDIYWENSRIPSSEELFTSKRRLDINASYGCSFICRFCFHLGITGDIKYIEGEEGTDVTFSYDRNIRWHSPRYVIDLVKHARDTFGVDYVLFLDENLMTMNSFSGWKWLPEIADLWISEGLQPQCRAEGKPHTEEGCTYGVHWGGTSHATLIKPDLLGKLHESGCSQLLYGLESFSDRILKNLGKGTTAKNNEQALKLTMESGIRPIPNQIIGFPDEFFDSIRDSMSAWDKLGIQVKPFFATPYPGSEWYYTYKNQILEQYDGDLEAFLIDLGDASRVTAVISENFNAVELLGLRELMVGRDYKRINEYEKTWTELHGEPIIPDFVHVTKGEGSHKSDFHTEPIRVVGLPGQTSS